MSPEGWTLLNQSVKFWLFSLQVNYLPIVFAFELLQVLPIKPDIMSRHTVVYVEACSFDNPLGGFVPGTKLS